MKEQASPETIARLADAGQDISYYFTNLGKMMPPRESPGVDSSNNALGKLNEAINEPSGTDSKL